MAEHQSLKLTAKEITAAFADPQWAKQFPPVMTLDQAADLLQIPKDTLYSWRSRGLLDTCSSKLGKRVRFIRDRLLRVAFNQGFSHAEENNEE